MDMSIFMIHAGNETNLMHYLSSVCSVTITLHVSGLLVAHQQEVTMYICNKWYVLYFAAACQLAHFQKTKTHTPSHLLRRYIVTT
jgi:hypothetical protein